MTHSVVLLTGCDANFYDFMAETLASLEALGLGQQADIGILDLGLSADQIAALRAKGYAVVAPEWTLNVPQELRKSYLVGFDARTCLQKYFPGYEVYLWFDADAWAQTDEFFHTLVKGAREQGAAFIREDGAGMTRNLMYNRWWYGHMVTSVGLLGGLRVAFPPAINAGIFALHHDAPHWGVWRTEYQNMIDRRRKLNLDQHALNAAVVLRGLPHQHAPARCNWICTLSAPRWNPQTKQFCEPTSDANPLSVLHLAGPDKRRNYTLAQVGGGEIVTPVTYEAYLKLR